MSEGAAKEEEKPRKFKAVRGTRDLLPPDTALWNRVEQTAREVFATYGFGEIRLPIFEQTDLFARAVGSETDIVSKEMYTLLDPPIWNQVLDKLGRVEDYGGVETTFGIKRNLQQSAWMAEVLSFRPEATASVCRAYIEHNMHQLPQPSEGKISAVLSNRRGGAGVCSPRCGEGRLAERIRKRRSDRRGSH